MSVSNRFDRQNRVYGIEGTQKLQNGQVVINGPICDLTYEISKNLALSGVNNIKLNLIAEDNNDFQLGNIDQTSIELFMNEINKLNPNLNLETIDDLSDVKNSTIVSINSVQTFDNSNKLIYFGVERIEDIFKFKFFNDFKQHIITDTDGENYELIVINEVSNNTLKTSGKHNLSESDRIMLLIDNNSPIYLSVKEIINPFTFTIKTNIQIEEQLKLFRNGYVQRQKTEMILNHEPIVELISNFDIKLINPIVQYYMGALISSEVIKAITNKYIPFNQSYEFEYNSQIALRPTLDISDKLNNLKCFIVGSGAIGCELLKNLTSLNVAINENSFIKITDPDHIEVSNLSRQFLFRSENVNKSKSIVAAERIKELNKDINIIPYLEKMSIENQNFTDIHFNDVDIVFNALDNISARLYIDSQIVKFQKPLFESGTLGTKGNTQPVIPFVTESYGASQDQADEQSFPACTIKHFPSLIQHTIHWAMDDFDGLFNKQPQIIKKFLETNTYDESNKNILQLLLNKLSTLNTCDDYIMWAYQLWQERFINRIARLLESHPESDQSFWSNGKKCPKSRKLDESAKDFIKSTTLLLFSTYQKLDIQFIKDFSFDEFININETYCDDPDKFTEITDIHLEPEIYERLSELIINPQEFEKDDDSNNHILFVQSCSNNRALNYGIPIISFYETKGIAGKIIPALATTTSIVASLVIIEMLKYLDNAKIEDYNSTYINLADNMIIQSEPIATNKYNVNNIIFSEWNTFESNQEMILKDFIEYWKNFFNLEISTVLSGSKILYLDGLNEQHLNKQLKYIIDNNLLNIGSDNESIILPNIKII